MQTLWCWRCQMEIPMMDEEEFSVFQQLIGESFERMKTGKFTQEAAFRPVFDYYKDLTGFDEDNTNALYHHRIALYGPPCESCGKPYRTPLASFCAACGHKRYDPNEKVFPTANDTPLKPVWSPYGIKAWFQLRAEARRTLRPGEHPLGEEYVKRSGKMLRRYRLHNLFGIRTRGLKGNSSLVLTKFLDLYPNKDVFIHFCLSPMIADQELPGKHRWGFRYQNPYNTSVWIDPKTGWARVVYGPALSLRLTQAQMQDMAARFAFLVKQNLILEGAEGLLRELKENLK